MTRVARTVVAAKDVARGVAAAVVVMEEEAAAAEVEDGTIAAVAAEAVVVDRTIAEVAVAEAQVADGMTVAAEVVEISRVAVEAVDRGKDKDKDRGVAEAAVIAVFKDLRRIRHLSFRFRSSHRRKRSRPWRSILKPPRAPIACSMWRAT